MNQSDIAAVVRGIAPVVRDIVAKGLADLALRISSLEERDPPAGEKGDPGEPGIAGPSGRDGRDGKDGQAGVDGKDGLPGRDGENGKDGRDGADGKSFSIEECVGAIEAAVSSAVKVAVDALPKQPTSFLVDEAGDLVSVYADGSQKRIGQVRGKDGLRGASVMDGAVDNEGFLSLRMSDGRLIQVGRVRGDRGKDGEARDGRPGRDALEIQIAPGVDESKIYSEGVCARWRGGLIRSFRQTDPIMDGDIQSAGWDVLLEGIAEESEREIDDGRQIERTTIYTSGRVFKRSVTTVSPIDRGVWQEGNYARGDGVSLGGSFFIARKDTSDKPGTSDNWRLAVKRGRDGRDGKIVTQRSGQVKI